jgi:hypothetical protein
MHCPHFGFILADVERLLMVMPQCYVSALVCKEVEILGRPALWRMDDFALGEGQAKEAIFAAGIYDSMVGHARFRP